MYKSGEMSAIHNGIPYRVSWDTDMDSCHVETLRVMVDCTSQGQFEVVRQEQWHRGFTKLGINRQILSGDAAFDQEFWILSDQVEFASWCFSDLQRREAVANIFRMGFKELNHNGKTMEAKLSFPRIFHDVDLSIITIAVPQLDILAKIESTPFQFPEHPPSLQGCLIPTVTFLLAIGGIVWWFWGSDRYTPLDGSALFGASLKYSIPALVLNMGLAVWAVRGRSSSYREIICIFLLSK